jgi:hypothetical protein
MHGMFAGAARNFQHHPRRRQYIAQNAENGVAITLRGGVLQAAIGHDGKNALDIWS